MADQTLSHYRIKKKLGSGGMGEVYLAEDTTLSRLVALKLLRPGYTQDEDRLRRFKQEAKAASAINHPNILTIHEIGEVRGDHFIATEFIDGDTLRERLKREDKIKATEVLAIAVQVASALVAAHEAGITHRDIKPENIMVRRDALVKVLDFGLAKLGLEDLAARELKRALEIDPTSEFAKGQMLGLYEMYEKYDEWLSAYRKFYPDQPLDVWYLLATGRLEEAQKAIEDRPPINRFNESELLAKKALLLALRQDFRAAEGGIPSILAGYPFKGPYYHHGAYDIACVYALEGKSTDAVKWLREAATTGFQCYHRFERDAYLDRIRQAPEFVKFMDEMKAQNEKYKREFQ